MTQYGRRVVARLLWQERRTVGVTLACSVLGAALEGTGIGLLIPLLQSITQPGAPPLQSGVQWIDHWILAVHAPPLQRLYHVSAAILASIVLRSFLGYLAQVSSLKTAQRILHRIRLMIFGQLSDLDLSFYTSHRSGELMNTMTAELQRVGTMFQLASVVVIRGLVLVAYAVLALWMSWELTAIALVLIAFLSVALKTIVAKTRGRGQEVARANAKVAAVTGEFIAGVKTVKAFGSEAYEMARFHRSSEEVVDCTVQTGRIASSIKPIAEALASAILIVLVAVSTRILVEGGDLAAPTLLAFLFALFRLLPIVHELNNARASVANLHGGWMQILRLLTRDGKPYLPEGTRTTAAFQREIRFDNVTFAYEPGRPVLRNINLSIGKGQTVALVGASGAGKSTLVDLIPRLADPTSGRILLDGVDLRDFRLSALRGIIAVVSQDTFLFHDTVSNNIAYGLDDVPHERVREVARLANALDFIEELPKGFDTILGDRGIRLSGGQRQRIAIARALLRDPEILILDEATSALDTVSERLIQDSLERLMENRTAVIIAHRLSTVEHADLVVVLEAGRVVEEGTYEALLARRGKLWDFHSLQTQAA